MSRTCSFNYCFSCRLVRLAISTCSDLLTSQYATRVANPLSYFLFLTFNLEFLENEAIVDVTFFLLVHLRPYIDLEGFRSSLALALFKFFS